MRVLAGEAKGSKLKALGRGHLRPTSSRVRNAIFSMLPAETLEGARVLELYAGTGALGIEALSRGARWVDFVEQQGRLCWVIRENLEAVGLSDKAHVYAVAVKKALRFLAEPYDLVLMDPPYEDGQREARESLTGLTMARLLKEGTVMVVEHAWRAGAPAPPEGLRLVQTRRYGDTAVSLFLQEEH